jgi:protein-S-isoprenylcysteine O-methyltransferase Ste14
MNSRKTNQRNGIEGAGPKIMLPMFITIATTAALSYTLQPLSNYPVVSTWTTLVGALLLTIGLSRWFLAVRTFFRAFSSGRLATKGPYAIMPNPIYGIFVVLIVPGISLALNWWPILLTSILGYAALRAFIHEEVTALQEKFGAEYSEYRKKVLIKFF